MLWIKSPDWSDATARLLHQTLAKAFYKTDDLVAIWIFIGMDPAKIDWRGSAYELWPALTKEADLDNSLRALIECVRDKRPALAPEFDLVLKAELPAESWYACANPFQAHLVGPGHRLAVLDRYRLRSTIVNLAMHDYHVLAVNGKNGSGRSYSRRVLQHVAHHHKVATDLIVVDAVVDLPNPAHALDLVWTLAAKLGFRVALDLVDPFTEDNRKAREAIALFVGGFRQLPPANRWFFLDSLDRAHVEGDLHAAVGLLAHQIETGQLGSTRLIVTGYPAEFSEDVNLFLQQENISQIGVPEIRTFFRDVATDIGQQLTESEIDRLAAEVAARAGEGGLAAIGKSASAVAHEHFGGAPCQ
jgi:Effector-associated domain 1